jgi:Leucine-rich repeat (LRR) protein
MPALPALTSLDLRGTRIASLQGMPALPALTSLDLSFTQQLASLRGMPALSHLQTINLKGSAIADVTDLTELPALEDITITKGAVNLSTIPSAIKSKVHLVPLLK